MLLTRPSPLPSKNWALLFSFPSEPSGSSSYWLSPLNTFIFQLPLCWIILDSFVPFNNYPSSVLFSTSRLFCFNFMVLTTRPHHPIAHPPPTLLKLRPHGHSWSSTTKPGGLPWLSFTLTFLQPLALQTIHCLESCLCTLDTQKFIKWLVKNIFKDFKNS